MMIKVNLKGNYKTVQEGERVLEITDAKVTPSGKPEKLVLNMKDIEDGASLMNTYSFNNETSLWAMGVMLSTALGLQDGDDFDTKDVEKLKGIKLRCEITHSEYNGKTYANVRRIVERVDVDDNTGVVEQSTTEAPINYSEVDRILYGKGRSAISNDLD